MTEHKSLYEYEWTEYPGLINDVLSGGSRLYALISARNCDYFVREDDVKNWQQAKSGRYEICDVDEVIGVLESVHETMSESLGDLVPIRHAKVSLWRFISPEGEPGFLGSAFEPINFDAECPEPLLVPFTRIIVESLPASNASCGINTPEHQVMVAVNNEYWAKGATPTAVEVCAWIDQKFNHLKLGKVRTEYIDRFCRPLGHREGRRAK